MSMRCESMDLNRRCTALGRALLTALAVLLALGGSACDSTVTESDLQKWTNNDLGLARIKEVVSNAEQPIDTRIRALEVVVEKGFPLRVRGFIDAIHDEGQRAEVVKRLAAQLLLHVEKRSKFQLDAKDCLMTLSRYMTPEQFEPVQKAVGAWAFSDITWDTPQSEVKDKVQTRISSGQIMDLGHYGWQAASVLIKNGFVVDKMVRYLGTAKDPVATEALLKGLRKLQASTGAQRYHIEALRSTESPAACAYLLEMYMNPEIEDEFRAGAFNVAVEMMALPSVKKDPKAVVEQLLKLIDTEQPEDRWLGATNLIHMSGLEHLDAILASFKDDKVYKKAEEDPAKSVMDLCLDIHDLGLSAQAIATFKATLAGDNRVQKSIAIVCLKANDGYDAKPELTALAKLTGDKDKDVDVDDFLGESLTLGALAQNALDGLAQLAVVSVDAKAGKYTEEQAKTRRLLTVFELAKTGDDYAQVVEQRYQGWVAEQKEIEREKQEKAKQGEQGAAVDGAPAEAP
ncbi:MAG: hypothetical protein EP329_08290, partial [Deltaproteobacteria bacterium]